MFKELDPLLHSQLRLSIIALLLTVDEADFTFLKNETGATAGNLSVQITKLEEAEYVSVKKSFVGKKPNTSCSITEKGRTAFETYMNTIQSYIPKT